MTKVLCDAMDCTHIRPMSTSVRDKPYLGYCQKRLVNMVGHVGYSGKPMCITYDKKETEQMSSK